MRKLFCYIKSRHKVNDSFRVYDTHEDNLSMAVDCFDNLVDVEWTEPHGWEVGTDSSMCSVFEVAGNGSRRFYSFEVSKLTQVLQRLFRLNPEKLMDKMSKKYPNIVNSTLIISELI